MLAHIRHLSDHAQCLVAHILRMARRKPHPHLRHLLRHHPQQFWEIYLLTPAFCLLTPVGIHILSQQRHLLEAPVPQVAHLTQYALHIATTLTSPRIGHDAVVAEVVAATHDTHETAYSVSQSDSLRHHILIGLTRGEFNVHRLVTRLRLSYQVRQ